MVNFVNKFQFVHILCLKMTSLKCNKNASNKKNTFLFNLDEWDAKNMSHQYNKGWKPILLFVPPRQICNFQH
jgi:hypothetical protein